MMLEENNILYFGNLPTHPCNLAPLLPQQIQSLNWQISCLNPRYAVPSLNFYTHQSPYAQSFYPVLPNAQSLYPVLPNTQSFYSVPPNSQFSAPPIPLARVQTPPLQGCPDCSATYICPHHFKYSPLAPSFCCHLCYTLHSFPPGSSKRKRFYRS